MGDMRGNTAKGPVLYYLDRTSREPTAKERFKVLLAELRAILSGTHDPGPESTANLAETLKTRLFDPFGDYSLTVEARDHLANDWFDRSADVKAMWQIHQPMEPIFCQGLITALEHAIYREGDPAKGERDQSLPINSIWVCVGYHYEVTVSENMGQITLLILTPELERDNFGLTTPPTPEEYDPHALLTVKRKFSMDGFTLQGNVDEGTVEEIIEDPTRGPNSKILVIRVTGSYKGPKTAESSSV